MEKFFRLLLALSSTSLLGAVYFIKQNYVFICLYNQPQLFSYIIVFLIPIFLTLISLIIGRFLQTEEIDSLYSIEESSNSFLPSYLGYFFVGLSVNTDETFWCMFIIIVIFTYLSQTNYFNPILLLFGYSFYSATLQDCKKILLISHTPLDNVEDCNLLIVKRINNTTFITKK